MLLEIELVAVLSHSKCNIIYFYNFSVFYQTDRKCKQCNNKCRRKRKNLQIYPADTHSVVNAAVIWWRHLPSTQIRTFLAWSTVSRLSHVPAKRCVAHRHTRLIFNSDFGSNEPDGATVIFLQPAEKISSKWWFLAWVFESVSRFEDIKWLGFIVNGRIWTCRRSRACFKLKFHVSMAW